MFKKKMCKKCGEKINSKHKFCPYCGAILGENREGDWGMLGENDFITQDQGIKFPRGLNMIFNSLIKNLNKQFSELDKKTKRESEKPRIRKTGVSISISSFGNAPPEIKINSFEDNSQKQQIKKTPLNNLSQKKMKKFSDLPKQEPSTNIRRFSNKIVYEIALPGVGSIKDISIIVLENSIEIKALAKDKIYFKLIPMNLPILNHDFSKGKLILELGERG